MRQDLYTVHEHRNNEIAAAGQAHDGQIIFDIAALIGGIETEVKILHRHFAWQGASTLNTIFLSSCLPRLVTMRDLAGNLTGSQTVRAIINEYVEAWEQADDITELPSLDFGAEPLLKFWRKFQSGAYANHYVEE